MMQEALPLYISAFLAAGLLITTDVATSASATEVRPGGALDLTVTGFARFLAHGGQLDDARQDNEFSRQLDFSNDTEMHFSPAPGTLKRVWTTARPSSPGRHQRTT